MTEQEKQQLSRDVAEKYGISSFLRHWHGYPVYEGDDIWLHDDSARCFDLMVEHGIDLVFVESFVIAYNLVPIGDFPIRYTDHQAKQEATRIAILKALLAKE